MDATALRRGVSRSELNDNKRETPRGERVASEVSLVSSRVASTVMYHGTSPWHPATFEETPGLTISLEPLYSFLALGLEWTYWFQLQNIDPTSAQE